MEKSLDQLVRRRAEHRCEYCHLPQSAYRARFQIDHVIAQKHKGPTVAENLALACPRCNNAKGPNLSGIDPQSGKVVTLFHPRREAWSEHFRWSGATLIGNTEIGRATVEVLNVNDPDLVAVRRQLMDEGISFV
jgi:HNH endonuclease